MDTVFWLLLGTSTGNLSFLHTIVLGSWPQPHSLISKLSMVRALRPASAPPDRMLPTSPEMVPLQGEGGVVPGPVCANKVRNGPASADQGFSTASQGSCHVHSTPCWNQPYPAFFASTKAKRTAPTDNMRSKSDDAIWHHWLLKG